LCGAKHDRVVLRRGGRDRDRVDVVAAKYLIKIIKENGPESLSGSLSSISIVIPDRHKISVWMLAGPRGVLGCMHVPESKCRYLDRIGHRQSFLVLEQVPSLAPRASTVAVGGDNPRAATKDD
jgi:hypothetical protein